MIQQFAIRQSGGGGNLTAGYGEIYVHDNAVSQTFANQSQYYQLNVGWVAGLANGFTADAANSRLLCNANGVYQASAVIDYSGPANQTSLAPMRKPISAQSANTVDEAMLWSAVL